MHISKQGKRSCCSEFVQVHHIKSLLTPFRTNYGELKESIRHLEAVLERLLHQRGQLIISTHNHV